MVDDRALPDAALMGSSTVLPTLAPWVAELTPGELDTPLAPFALGPVFCRSEKTQSAPFFRHDRHGLSLPKGAEHFVCSGKDTMQTLGSLIQANAVSRWAYQCR